MWRDKENYPELVDKELRNLEMYFDEKERSLLKRSALSHSDSGGSDHHLEEGEVIVRENGEIVF